MELAGFASSTSIAPGIIRYDGAVLKGTGAADQSRSCLVVFEDEPEWSFMPHYFHFMEYLTALIYGLDHAGLRPQDIDAVAFPNSPGETWKGSFHGHNHHLLKAFLPSLACVINKDELCGGIRTVSARHLLVITRKRMEHGAINKMCAGIFPEINHDKIQSFVYRVYAYLGLLDNWIPPSKPVVTYIARNRSKRRLPPPVERKLVQKLSGIGTVEFQKVSMENLSFKEQIAVARRTTIMIGIHGNGLTHAFFMPPKGIVVEIFPKGTFQFDYFSIAQIRDHRYFAFNTNRATPFRDYRVHGSTSRRVRRININEIAGIVSAHRHFM